MGSTVSGGQRQRLTLACALYQSPRIFFLDEATSNLDPAAEKAVENVLNELLITKVIVTHRPGTAERADRIYIMGAGSGIEVEAAEAEAAAGSDSAIDTLPSTAPASPPAPA